MIRNVLEAVNKARDFFGIEGFPGNFFTRLEEVDYINKYNLLLFKEDLDKLSGFIGYGKGDMSVICINYKRPIGHQNFTLTHEIGHWFLHKGKSLSDDDLVLYSSDFLEKEANEFAKELLYPEQFLLGDYDFAKKNDLFVSNNRVALGEFVNELCHTAANGCNQTKKNHPVRRCTCYNALIRYLCTNPSGTKFPCKHSYERMIL